MGNCCQAAASPIIKPGVSYADITSQIAPLDLICFKGDGFWARGISYVEQIALGSGEWTHCGLVVTREQFTFGSMVPHKLYLLESTYDPSVKDVTGEIIFGVQVRDLETVLAQYDASPTTRIGWVKLKSNPLLPLLEEDPVHFQARYQMLSRQIKELYQHVHHELYEYNPFAYVQAIVPSCCPPGKSPEAGNSEEQQPLDKRYFCSELVVRTYQFLDVIPRYYDPGNVAPIELFGYSNDGYVFPLEKPVPIRWEAPRTKT